MCSSEVHYACQRCKTNLCDCNPNRNLFMEASFNKR